MSDVEAIPQTVQSHRHHRSSRRSKSKPETKVVTKKTGGGLGLGFFLSVGSIVGLVILGIFMMNEIWSIKKTNKGIVQIKTNLMSIQQKVMEQEMNFSKLIHSLTRPKKQEVVEEKQEVVKSEEEDSEEEDDDEED
jgi:hypothetical protein|tara:strand:+ start:645 stop:1052 length:408 start_codon:yes stop_codon:yes gene_type:complete